ncbi:GreA/GreB family elongation factor [Patescibacteria group bacterium]|nr:GreA/GreB family elongation factor [Patescibacteria group bacterium]
MTKKSVSIGSRVLVETFGRNYRFQIVDSMKADPTDGKISGESPIGKALLGHGRSEKVKVNLFSGESVYYKIVRVY